MPPFGHECLLTIRCDCSNWLQSPTHFIHYFIHYIPCWVCTVPHQGHHGLDVSLILSLDLRTAHLQNECVDLSGVPLLSIAFSETFPLLLKPHPPFPCVHLWITSASRVNLPLSVWSPLPWRRPLFYWCKLYSRWLWKAKLGFVIFHINRREDFLKIKAVENKKNNSTYKGWGQGPGDEGILHWMGR